MLRDVTVLSRGHDRFAGLQSVIDQNAVSQALANCDIARLHCAIRRDDENEGASLTLLHGAQRHGEAILPDAHSEVNSDEFARP